MDKRTSSGSEARGDRVKEGGRMMRFAGTDIGVERHMVAVLDEQGVGPLTAACLIAELGDPARFDSPGAIASYVGVIPRIRQVG